MPLDKQTSGRIRAARTEWEEGVLKKNLQRMGLTASPVEVSSPLDIGEDDFLEMVGFPGEYPFTAGRFAIPLHHVIWGRGKTLGGGKSIRHAFGYAGYGTPEDMRDFYIERGKTMARGGGPNIAFDLPTQIGYDSDHELAEGEVGRVGVAIDTLKDFETIYEAFTGDTDLDRIASNWTINATTNIILAMYVALAEKRGIPPEKLRGTPQNDILKEFIARGTQVFPVGPSLRMTRDTFTYCNEHLPNMNTISVCGYHIREAGATRVQAVAFAMANAMAYFKVAMNAGMAIDQVAAKATFLNFGGGMEFLKEVSCRRAARRVWAKIMRNRLGARKPSNWIYRELGGGLAGFWTCTRQRPLNNLVRVAIGAAFAAMIGEPPACEPPYDEALGLGHSIEARQLAADASRIIMEECLLGDTPDVFAGSYYVESLTDRYEAEIFGQIEEIDRQGGAEKAVESGWMKNEVLRSAEDFQRKLETGKTTLVGVNKYTEADEIDVMTPRTSPYEVARREQAEERQIANLKRVKKERDHRAVQACLEKIENAARDERANLIPHFIEAVKAYVTMGEICDVLRRVFGEAH
jgi:methylmalonyl-CoA mutase N-terminal domain/subunit